MRGMEVHLNGGKLCTAGISADAALNVSVDIVGLETDYQMTLRVGGLERDEFVIWADRELGVGDEIKLRIVEIDVSDAPLLRNPYAVREP